MNKRLLYYCPLSYGGIADYAHAQATALVKEGCEVTMLCQPEFVKSRESAVYKVVPTLASSRPSGGGLYNKARSGLLILTHISQLIEQIKKHSFQYILFASYMEYMAPLWAFKLRTLTKKGIKFSAIIHDPVRDFIVGPLWWHQYSVWSAYSFLSEAFIHEEIRLDTVKAVNGLRVTVIPHGIYKFPAASISRAEMRKKLQIPDDKKIALSFGHIRDGKNLDLILKAMVYVPSLYLIVAGKEQSADQKTIDWYKKLASELGVQERCIWIHGHISEDEVANLFQCSDIALVLYSSQFHSASGVINVAVNYQKPCLASSGDGPLKSTVEKYQLGIFVAPDSIEEIIYGFNELLKIKGSSYNWTSYQRNYTWKKNAMLTIGVVFDE